jgi:hypothetical protein
MLRIGVIVLLLGAASVLVAAQGRSSASASIQHTCGLTDHEFIGEYQVEMESVGMYGTDYLNGQAKASDVISATDEASHVVRATNPYDPTLQTVRRLAPGMFSAYADAVRARERGGTAARQMYLAYSVGARVREVLREGQPGLKAAGCDIADLLQ